MCFDLLLNEPVFFHWIELWLLIFKLITGLQFVNSLNNDFKYKSSLQQSVAAMYSASVDDNDTIGCLLLHHDTGPPDNIITKPIVLLVFKSLA